MTNPCSVSIARLVTGGCGDPPSLAPSILFLCPCSSFAPLKALTQLNLLPIKVIKKSKNLK